MYLPNKQKKEVSLNRILELKNYIDKTQQINFESRTDKFSTEQQYLLQMLLPTFTLDKSA